jgi:hypothetical protein
MSNIQSKIAIWCFDISSRNSTLNASSLEEATYKKDLQQQSRFRWAELQKQSGGRMRET